MPYFQEYRQQMADPVPEEPEDRPRRMTPRHSSLFRHRPRLPQIPGWTDSGPIRFQKCTGTHLRTAGKALVNWWRAVTIEGLCVAVLWLIGLLLLRVPLAPVWALIAGLMTLVPNFGGVIAPDGQSGLLHPGHPTQHGSLVCPARHVCGHCCPGPTLAATAHPETGDPGARLGLDPGSHRAGHCYSLLGNPVGTPVAGRGLCFPPPLAPLP